MNPSAYTLRTIAEAPIVGPCSPLFTVGQFIVWHGMGWIVHSLEGAYVTLRVDGSAKVHTFPRVSFYRIPGKM